VSPALLLLESAALRRAEEVESAARRVVASLLTDKTVFQEDRAVLNEALARLGEAQVSLRREVARQVEAALASDSPGSPTT